VEGIKKREKRGEVQSEAFRVTSIFSKNERREIVVANWTVKGKS